MSRNKFYNSPTLDKKVIYLDQFVLSNIYNPNNCRDKNNVPFYNMLESKIKKAFLYQQAIFPNSNIHFDESINYFSPEKLIQHHEGFSGETSFNDYLTIERTQVCDSAKSWIKDETHVPDFSIDKILNGKRNIWLPNSKLLIRANLNYKSPFFENISKTIDIIDLVMQEFFKLWQGQKVDFHQFVNKELSSLRVTCLSQIEAVLLKSQKGELSTNDILNNGWIIYVSLTHLFKQHKIPEKDLFNKIKEFLNSTNIEDLPSNKIRAYMLAGLAEKCYGQKNFLLEECGTI